MPVAKLSFQDSPFDLNNHAAYAAWKTRKLEGYLQYRVENRCGYPGGGEDTGNSAGFT